jgi:DNA helicase II / ATP-dependent DNA helicase PcrA
MELTVKQNEVLAADNNLLVIGGPGSGKTTISILKAAQIVESLQSSEQKVLFLSFARATISRVIEAIAFEQEILPKQKRQIAVETYHSFFWRILNTHGYLLGLKQPLSILTPPNEAIALSTIRSSFPPEKDRTPEQEAELASLVETELKRLAMENGEVCFDLFAKMVTQILRGSKRVRDILSVMHPVIILDEFQDTNLGQWEVVQALGDGIRLIALADPEQRIYDWIGADPERLNQYIDKYFPTQVDLSDENHRSPGTEIAKFANDMLKGKFSQGEYIGVGFKLFPSHANGAYTKLITTTYEARTRLISSGKPKWSLAILVPTKRMTRVVSDSFRNPIAGMQAIPHTATVDMEAAILGAEIIAYLLQPNFDNYHFNYFIKLLCGFFRGKGGGTPTKTNIEEAERLARSLDEYNTCKADGRPIKGNSILKNTLEVYRDATQLDLIGNPDEDWLAMRKLLASGKCTRLKQVAEEVRNVRILERGMQLRMSLSQDWREYGVYMNALELVRGAFVQEHFSTASRPEQGVIVMNMHKSKGKQFDEVVIFEGWPQKVKGKIVANVDRVVRQNLVGNINDQNAQNFRVSITRGKSRVTILTPQEDVCVLLSDRNP